MAERECRCLDRNNCGNSSRINRNNSTNEMPVKDSQRNLKFDGELPPPRPSGDGNWELQFCKWMGWTWVNKGDKSVVETYNYRQRQQLQQPLSHKEGKWMGWKWENEGDKSVVETRAQQPQHPPPPQQPQHPHLPQHPQQQPQLSKLQNPAKSSSDSADSARRQERKKKNICWCFKSKTKSPPKSVPQEKLLPMAPIPPPPQLPHPALKKSEPDIYKGERVLPPEDSHECCCCRMNSCCCCDQVCCPCMMQAQMCCCCCNDTESEPEPERVTRDLKTIETQTFKEVKEQATKTSEMCVPKKKLLCCRKRKCKCVRPMCCPCTRNACCPCIQKMCCPCNKGTDQTNVSSKIPYSEQLVNYCFQNNSRKLSKSDFLNLKSSNFSTLHKSLEILLRNNINVMNLFDDKKELRNDYKPASCYSSNHTISGLSDNLVKTDPEHCKILTAVCDAILSSHKFDREKYVSKATRKLCEEKDSQNSFNIFSSRGFLEKILSDLNFPVLTKSDNDFNAYKEIGVQVEKLPFARLEMQPKRSLTKLVRNRSRVLRAARFPKKVEALRRNTEMLRLGHDARGARRNFFLDRIKDNRGKTEEIRKNENKTSDNKLNLIEVFKNSDKDSTLNKWKLPLDHSARKAPDSNQQSLKLEHLESLLNSIDYINSSSSGINKENNREDSDLLLNIDESRPESNRKEKKRSPRGNDS